MCIICSDQELGQEYLNSITSARQHLKVAESALLKLSKKYPKSNYGNAHKKLVKARKDINRIEEMREQIENK